MVRQVPCPTCPPLASVLVVALRQLDADACRIHKVRDAQLNAFDVAIRGRELDTPRLQLCDELFEIVDLKADVIDPPLVFGERGRLLTIDNPSARWPLEIIRPTAFLEAF